MWRRASSSPSQFHTLAFDEEAFEARAAIGSDGDDGGDGLRVRAALIDQQALDALGVDLIDVEAADADVGGD